jgi:tetratricopeptide (TPR) repeat protein
MQHNKNIVTGNLNTEGGDAHIGDIYYNSVDYKNLTEKIADLTELYTNSTGERKATHFQRLETAKKELEAFKKGVISLAETFQKIELNTQRLQQAKAYFEQGNFEAARAILDTEQLENDQEQLLKQKAALSQKTQQNEKDLQHNANEYLVKAQLTAIDYTLPNRFEQTIALFEASLKSDRNVENLFVYAHFLQKHNQDNKAVPFYEEALAIYRTLAQANPQTFLPHLAATLNNLGLLHSNKKEYKKAEKDFLEALKIYRTLAQANPQTFLPYDATTLNNLGVLQRANNEYEKAEKDFLEALKIYRTLAKSNPQTFLPHLAATLNNLGLLQFDKNEYAEAEEAYLEALGIRRTLAQDNPQTFLPHVAATLNNLGALYSNKKEYKKAEKDFLEALKIYRTLAQSNPQAFLPYLAGTQINMSIFYQKSKIDKEQSFQLVDEAITNLLPFGHIPYIQNYLNTAYQVLEAWDIDVETYLAQKLKDHKAVK